MKWNEKYVYLKKSMFIKKKSIHANPDIGAQSIKKALY